MTPKAIFALALQTGSRSDRSTPDLAPLIDDGGDKRGVFEAPSRCVLLDRAEPDDSAAARHGDRRKFFARAERLRPLCRRPARLCAQAIVSRSLKSGSSRLVGVSHGPHEERRASSSAIESYPRLRRSDREDPGTARRPVSPIYSCPCLRVALSPTNRLWPG
jgi:hypothetical protein